MHHVDKRLKTRSYAVFSQSRRHSGAGKDKVLDKFINGFWVAKTFARHASITTHMNLSEDERQILEINEGHIRLSVGLEHADDLVADIQQALNVCRGF